MMVAVLRVATNSLLSLLMAVTFLWGGCVSCEQFFMFTGTGRQCCNKAGQCERPKKESAPSAPKQDCKRMPLALRNGPHLYPVMATLPAAIEAVVPQPLAISFRLKSTDLLLEHSPPDLQALNATFLI
jgi:hypothetical protein